MKFSFLFPLKAGLNLPGWKDEIPGPSPLAWCFDFRTREGKMINYNMEPAVNGLTPRAQRCLEGQGLAVSYDSDLYRVSGLFTT